MHLPPTAIAFAPSAGDYLENFVLLGCGLLLFIFALALCSFLLDKLSKAFGACADWLERGAACRHKRRRACLKKHYQPMAPRASHLRAIPSPSHDDSLARNALQRNAEAHLAGRVSAPHGPEANLRLVKPRGKV